MQYTIPKGCFDILPSEPKEENQWNNSDRWIFLEETIRSLAHAYGFKDLRTPIFEKTELFVRGVGESSDIVTKEMYTFLDKAGRSMTLRPEGTAPAIRAFIENRLDQQPGLHKYYYIGPMFRYERPQAGRYRQFHQFGAEAIGIAGPEQDVEIIDMLMELYRRLGLKDLTIMINSVGDEESRTAYKNALSKFLEAHLGQLSEESQARFTKNVLRILDSKDPEDQRILQNAPSILDHLNEEAKAHFERVQFLLKKSGLPFVINHKLVRGLDYYNKTVFEIACGELGAQNAIVGGGRYDGLVSALGGPNLPAVGFATGLERLLQILFKQKVPFPPAPHPLVFIIPLGKESLDYCFDLLTKLRRQMIFAELDCSGKKLQHSLQLANAIKAEYTLVIGNEEISQQKVNIKNMTTRESQNIALSDIVNHVIQLAKNADTN